jgi:hypothetical protein
MRRLTPLLAVLPLAGCPGPDPDTNPPRLWLALNGNETMVRLVPEEPEPY